MARPERATRNHCGRHDEKVAREAFMPRWRFFEHQPRWIHSVGSLRRLPTMLQPAEGDHNSLYEACIDAGIQAPNQDDEGD